MIHGRSVWRARLGLFAVLGALVVANVAVLVSYKGFYDSRVVTLQETQKKLEARKGELNAALEGLRKSEERLTLLRDDLASFYGETLGQRKERLAGVIEDVYALTRRAGMRPDEIAYTEDDAGRLAMSFLLRGKYIDVKKLMAELETSPQFFVLEGIAVAADDADPDGLKVNVTVTHYFQTVGHKVPKGRAPRPAVKRASVPAPKVKK